MKTIEVKITLSADVETRKNFSEEIINIVDEYEAEANFSEFF